MTPDERMLLAELNGKSCPAARDSEDYLTSAVFGHLRYVPPGVFWDGLLAHARGLPGSDGTEPALASVLAGRGCLPSAYERLAVAFWRNHPDHGEPDLLLVFSGADRAPLVLLVEVKLWSGKSEVGEYDQLARYLRVLDDPAGAGLRLPAEAARYLVYLTPRDSLAEVAESVPHADRPEADRGRLFRLQWQDVLLAAREAARQADGVAGMILGDVAGFLSRLGLEYFDRCRRLGDLPVLTARDGRFYYPDAARAGGAFRGLGRVETLPTLTTRDGRFYYPHQTSSGGLFSGLRRLTSLPQLSVRDGRFYYPDRTYPRGAFIDFGRVAGLDFIAIRKGRWVG